MKTLGGLDLLLLGPSWKYKAVCFIPYENLLIPSNAPDKGLVNSPAKPFNVPLTSPPGPLLR